MIGIHMAVDFEAVTELCRLYADDVRHAYPVDKVILFGSYAKGTADPQSDIDICFFLFNYGGKMRTDIMVELFGLTRRYKRIPFEPLVFETSELENDNPFVKEILRTGMEIL
jgi:predicted nucleotidyltransferase